MTSSDIRKKYLAFFQKHGHVIIPSAPLVPENDPTTLFTSSGMQPLVPYLLGEPHPLGKRLTNSQKSFRAQDIDEIGDNRHTTFFEMLGNWSLGDPASADGVGAGYFKKEQLSWIFEFLTKELGIDPHRLYVSVFEGNDSVPKDVESIEIWKELFLSVGIRAEMNERIFLYPAKKNWWSRSGEPEKMATGEPGGPDSEIFFDFGKERGLHEKSSYKNKPCHPNCDCGRFMEIGNSVFMQYQKQQDGSLKELPQKNVDFGGGLERLNAVVNVIPDIFLTDSYSSIITIIESSTHHSYSETNDVTTAMRIIADHLRGAVMMMADGVEPSNKGQGYILRRLIRRSLLYGKRISLWGNWNFLSDITHAVSLLYKDAYPEIQKKEKMISDALILEAKRFGKTLDMGLKEIEKISVVSGKDAFTLYETYGFPWEMTEEIVKQKGQSVDRKQFEEEFEKHKNLSRTAAAGMFKGGLADHSEETTKLHTATHMLHQALRMTLGDHVEQKGSNITVERLRFDFSHPQKMTEIELKEVEKIVNEQIKKNIPVTMREMDIDEAGNAGALGFFKEKYGNRVKVYTVGFSDTDYFSREICGGPHVSFTGELGNFTIIKEESAGSGVRRIYARVGTPTNEIH